MTELETSTLLMWGNLFFILGSTAVCYYASRRYMRDVIRARKQDAEISTILLDAMRAYNRHDERVKELLAANNGYLERARKAEANVAATNSRFALLADSAEGLENELRDRESALADAFEQIDGLKMEMAEILENNLLLEQELRATKDALALEEAEANKWSAEYHRIIGKPEAAVAH